MNSGFFILQRHFMRVDGVLIRIIDTRFHGKFGTSYTNIAHSNNNDNNNNSKNNNDNSNTGNNSDNMHSIHIENGNISVKKEYIIIVRECVVKESTYDDLRNVCVSMFTD